MGIDAKKRKRANSPSTDKIRQRSYRKKNVRSSSESSSDDERRRHRKSQSSSSKKRVARSPSPSRKKRRKRRPSSDSNSRSSSSSRSVSPRRDKKKDSRNESSKAKSSSKRSRRTSESPEKSSRDKGREKDRHTDGRSKASSSSSANIPSDDRKSRSDHHKQTPHDKKYDQRKMAEIREGYKKKEDKAGQNGDKAESSNKDSSQHKSKGTESKSKVDTKAVLKEENIEDEMKKRKERIEAWRAARKAEEKTDTPTEEDDAQAKKWNLEDEDEEDEGEDVNKPTIKQEDGEEKVKETEAEEEDVDPLEAYMKEVQKEVKKVTYGTSVSSKGKTATTIVRKVVKKTDAEDVKAKPELMEQNQDLMEFSSGDEKKKDPTDSLTLGMQQKKKKELAAADHSKIYYQSFRKDFYVEVPELAKMSPEDVNVYREELENIRVRGKLCPKPIKKWAQTGVNLKILDVLKKSGFEKPTPIQTQAIPAIMSGRDMIGIAKTGSGKTLAFLLPMFRHILDQAELEQGEGPIGIIMTPTRELALQIYKDCRKFCKSLHLTVVCIYGGSGISEQIAELKRGAEIIVCTPGRMIDMLTANNGRVSNCRRCTYLVLDEADRMFDLGFEPQVMKIIDNIRPDKQTVMFSATFPRQMEALARRILTKPIEVQVGGRSVVCADVTQHVVLLEEDNKFLKLLELLGLFQEDGSILVFVEKQDSADSLFKDLLKRGYPCLSLHGGMDQFDRDSTIADFKNGVTKLMIATSVAARGLDVKNLIVVINYDCPNHYEDYVHRAGRTGRAGNKGSAYTFITPEQGRFGVDVMKAFDQSSCPVPDDLLAFVKQYKLDLKTQGKELKCNSGFSGKGFKFDAEEKASAGEMKKMQKWSSGLQDSDDEAEAAENAMDRIEQDLDDAFRVKPKKSQPKVSHAISTVVITTPTVAVPTTTVAKDKLDKASSIAAMINMKMNQAASADKTQQATSQIMKGGALERVSGIGLAKQLADKVHAKINYKAPEPEKEEKEEEKEKVERYEVEIDINDFPQQARWKITSKDAISSVQELAEVGITVRGVYIQPGKTAPDGEKKLHLYLEALSERNIEIAQAEIKRLLKEELIRVESSTYRPKSGRYKVV